MDVLLFILIMLLMISIPVLLIFFFFRWAKRSKYKKLLNILALIPLAIVAYAVYDALYPADKLFKEDFEEVTGMRFPDHAEILSKSASFPDTHGDYTSAAAVQLLAKEYVTLSDHLKYSGAFAQCDYPVHTKELREVESDLSAKVYTVQFVKEFDDKIYMVGFVPGERIIFCRTSW